MNPYFQLPLIPSYLERNFIKTLLLFSVFLLSASFIKCSFPLSWRRGYYSYRYPIPNILAGTAREIIADSTMSASSLSAECLDASATHLSCGAEIQAEWRSRYLTKNTN